jgi:hypothetical protein
MLTLAFMWTLVMSNLKLNSGPEAPPPENTESVFSMYLEFFRIGRIWMRVLLILNHNEQLEYYESFSCQEQFALLADHLG